MARLTGKHPFNSEPPLTHLMYHSFITLVPLYYVRNNGTIPKANWDDWMVEVCGLVKCPTKFTMDQLVKEFASRGIPVTLVCAKNRRKEQNMVKQSMSFNWGVDASSSATTSSTGVSAPPKFFYNKSSRSTSSRSPKKSHPSDEEPTHNMSSDQTKLDETTPSEAKRMVNRCSGGFSYSRFVF